jgi:hypothetical protein
MKNLNQETNSGLLKFIKGVVSAYEYNDTIDERYNLEFKVYEVGEKSFKIYWDWVSGEIQYRQNDPELMHDATPIIQANWVIINKNEDYRKLTKEVMDAISEVTAAEFNEEL